MKKIIVIHCTGTPEDEMLSMEDIAEINSQERNQDPMPYHYVVDQDGKIRKGKRDKELCCHCGRWSRDSLSFCFVGGMHSEDGTFGNTMTEEQEKAMVFLLREYGKRFPGIEVKGCNEVLHPDEAREDYEPYFDVGKWMSLSVERQREGN